MSLNLNYESIVKLCPRTSQVMVYGYGNTNYKEIAKTLKQDSHSPIRKVFDSSLGKPQMNMSTSRTLEGTQIELVRLEAFPSGLSSEAANHKQCKRECKAALTNLVFENYKRKKEGLPVIPVLFCLDSPSNKHPLSVKGMLDRSMKESALITHSELRRAYKLCFDRAVDSEVREAARETFIFARVLINPTDSEYALTKMDAPWEMDTWEEEWASRKSSSQYHDKEFPWKRQLEKMTQKYNFTAEHPAPLSSPHLARLSPSSEVTVKKSSSTTTSANPGWGFWTTIESIMLTVAMTASTIFVAKQTGYV